MSRKKFTIWLDEDSAERFRKRAIAEGRTLSETGAGLVELALTSDDGSGMPQREPADADGIEEIKKLLTSLKERSVPSVSGKDIWSKDAVVSNLSLLSRIYSLMLFLSLKADGGGHPDRVKAAKGEAEKLLQKLGFIESEGA